LVQESISVICSPYHAKFRTQAAANSPRPCRTRLYPNNRKERGKEGFRTRQDTQGPAKWRNGERLSRKSLCQRRGEEGGRESWSALSAPPRPAVLLQRSCPLGAQGLTQPPSAMGMGEEPRRSRREREGGLVLFNAPGFHIFLDPP